MRTAEYIRQQTRNNARTFRVYRPSTGRSYDGDDEVAGTVDVWVFDASATASVVTEGVDEETSLTGLLRPIDDLQGGVAVGDEIRLASDESRRYEVETKVGVPTELEPTVWQLGIERANSA